MASTAGGWKAEAKAYGQSSVRLRFAFPMYRDHPTYGCTSTKNLQNQPFHRLQNRSGQKNGHSWNVFVDREVNDEGMRTFSDVSAWYWSATFGTTEGPWWAVTVITTKQQPRMSLSDSLRKVCRGGCFCTYRLPWQVRIGRVRLHGRIRRRYRVFRGRSRRGRREAGPAPRRRGFCP